MGTSCAEARRALLLLAGGCILLRPPAAIAAPNRSVVEVRAYAGGGVSFLDRDGLIGVLETQLWSKQHKEMYVFRPVPTASSTGMLVGTLTTTAGLDIHLKGSLTPQRNALNVTLDMSPSADVEIAEAIMVLRLPHDEWLGASYYLEGDTFGSVTSRMIEPSEARDDQQSLILASSKSHHGLNLEMGGPAPCKVNISDMRNWKDPAIQLELRRKDAANSWKAGSHVQFALTISFNRNVRLNKATEAATAFEALKAGIRGRPLLIETSPPEEPSAGTPPPKYSVPNDAETIEMTFDASPSVLATFQIRGKSYTRWLVWDTGSGAKMSSTYADDSRMPGMIPVTEAFLREAGIALAKETYFTRSVDGTAQSVKGGLTVVSDERGFCSDGVDPVPISVEIGPLKLERVALVAFNQIDERLGIENGEPQDASTKIVGLFPYPLMAHYLMSMDIRRKKIFLRPLASARRTFFANRPLGEVGYGETMGTPRCPVVINGRIKGSALVDTGAFGPAPVRVNTSVADPLLDPVTSFKLGTYDLAKRRVPLKVRYVNPSPVFINGGVAATKKFDPWKMDEDIAWIGCSLFADMFVTFDPKLHKIYFERDYSGSVGPK